MGYILTTILGFLFGYFSGHDSGHKTGYSKGYFVGKIETIRNQEMKEVYECDDCVVGVRCHNEMNEFITESDFYKLAGTSMYDPNVMYEIKKFEYCPCCGKKINWKRRT